MELAPTAVSRSGDAFIWRLLATATSFILFGMGCLTLRLFVFPLLACLPGGRVRHRERARRTISWLFWRFVQFMRAMGVLTYEIEGAERLGRPGQMIIANHPSLIDVVFLIGLVRQANCVVKQSLFDNPFTRGPVSEAQYIGNDGSMDMLDAAVASLQQGQTLVIFPEGTRTSPGQPPAFHRGAAAIALRGASVITPVTIKVSPTTLTKNEPWYRIPGKRVHFILSVGPDVHPDAYAALAPAPKASRLLNDYLHNYYIKELAADERATARPQP
ncbi:lysophospholipid acyltransferase family protein [Pseudomonas fulva]|uniref:lysophospholipid acyltransferase family protein n=1 Tax=Pseudomonas fulva TaxID=47880 RepID=UPI0018A88C46|nr:lysophospholipid acyltransferase family protein [Pseudomonas fulva]MBF8776083.1 1-acyl-sn-glycerol-3-phosphate acyltransferase [Pseudomonas fulva]